MLISTFQVAIHQNLNSLISFQTQVTQQFYQEAFVSHRALMICLELNFILSITFHTILNTVFNTQKHKKYF